MSTGQTRPDCAYCGWVLVGSDRTCENRGCSEYVGQDEWAAYADMLRDAAARSLAPWSTVR